MEKLIINFDGLHRSVQALLQRGVQCSRGRCFPVTQCIPGKSWHSTVSAQHPQTDSQRRGDSPSQVARMATATLQSFNVFLTDRLTAAAVEIYGFVEKTVVEYQEEVYRTKLENQRLQRLVDLVYKPELRLHRAGMRLWLPFPSRSVNVVTSYPLIKPRPIAQA